MKDDTSTPTNDGTSPNEFEAGKPGTNARSDAEAAIEELRQKGGIFVGAVRATRMPMALTDPTLPGNPIIFANPAFLKLSGYSMDEVLGQQPHFMNGPATDPHDAARFAEALRSDQDDIIETVQYRKDGSRFVATVLLSAFKDDEGNVLNHFMSWLDVTRRVDAEDEVAELKATQAALRENETKFRAVFETMNEACCIFDLITDDDGKPVDWRILEANPGYERESGLKDVVGRLASEFMPGTEPCWIEMFGRVAETGEGEHIEEWHEPTGRWIHSSTARVGGPGSKRLASVFFDITERKRAEEALRESEARLKAAFESVPAGLAILDLNGRAVIANPEFRRFLPTGVIPSRDPERGKQWKAWDNDGQLLDPQDWPSARALRGESVVPGQEMLFTGDDGRQIWTNVATAPTFDEAGNVTGVVSVISDIDTRKQAEESLQRSERHAQTLLAELQHRVRNTLAVVRTIARRTAENTETSDEMLAHFQGRLDAFSRVQAAVTRNPGGKVDLTALIEDELVAHATHEGARVKLEGASVELQPKIAERLSLAIHELTTNAVKHGALANTGGKICITWEKLLAAGGEQLLLNWKESGVDTNGCKLEREGFGMELLRRSLPYDLQGETKVDLDRDGLRFELRVPLPRTA